ncbi:protein GVQW3-like [Odontomachus brunneus]|uniref:protein GVQW3-like n=1 Tax=Odontomachus brunneus TaxID=486640 RepID=UPI0013F22F8F|nr:protein GVQW3-like [Odontomachus brunneus]
MLQKTYGDSALSKTCAYEWYKAFKEGREVVEDLPRSGRLSTSLTEDNIEKVKEIVLENRYFSLREVAHELNMSHESVRSILVDNLGMRRVAAKLVPKDLNKPSHRATIVGTTVLNYDAKLEWNLSTSVFTTAG